jgi:hypothetical protein
MNEPMMDAGSGSMPDPAAVQNADPNQQQPANTNPDGQSRGNEGDNGEGGETQPNQPKDQQGGETQPSGQQQAQPQFQEIIDGWREDRQRLDALEIENRELKDKLSKGRTQQDEDEELEGLSESEKVNRIVERREKEKEEKEKAEKEEVEREVRFYERTDPFFKENKAKVIQIAADFNVKNLAQAIAIAKGQFQAAGNAAGNQQYHDNRKRNAGGMGGGNAGGSQQVKPYDPKADSGKSFGDFYREAGIT